MSESKGDCVRVKLIFCAKQKLEKGQKLRVSVKNEWVYILGQSPSKTINMTLKKYKLIKGGIDEDEITKKYRIYRVREDQTTKYRYVTEILSKDEGK